MKNFAQKDTDEWHFQRRKFICASELGAFIGVDPYTSRKKLLEVKEGYGREEKSPLTESYMNWGKCMEAAALYALDRILIATDGRGCSFSTPPLVHGTVSCFCGTPDAITVEDGTFIPIEIKCPAYPSPDTAYPYQEVGNIPMRYLAQVQGYMELLNSPYSYLCCWTIYHGMTLWRVWRSSSLFPIVVWPLLTEWKQRILVPRVSKAEKAYYKNILVVNVEINRLL